MRLLSAEKPALAALLTTVLTMWLLFAACGAEEEKPAAPTTLPTRTPAPPEPTATAEPTTPRPTLTATAAPGVETIATGLSIPWAITFAPDGRIFLTERPGTIRVIENGRLRAEPLADLRSAVAHVGEGGLLGLALDPAFAENHHLYVYYTYRDAQGRIWNRVVRLTERGGRAADETILLDGIPGAQIHDGGRLKFGPDGKLYISTGDAAQPSLSQDLNSLAGKILRINADGSIPAANPFPGSPVYSYGHRNPQGLAWHPTSGDLFISEHGPTGFDEVNVIRPGGNYGWPTVRGIAGDERFSDPISDFSPAVAPSGATFYDGDRFPCWRGVFFFATLRGNHLHRLALTAAEPYRVGESERLLDGDFGRLRDVAVGPDGFLYVLTSNRDGRGSPAPDDDRLLRVPGPC